MICHHESGVIGDHAAISPQAATVICRLLGDWSRDLVRLGLADHFPAVDQAIGALLEASARTGTREATGKHDGDSLGAWLSTKQVADQAGASTRWVRELHGQGRIPGHKIGNRLLFPPTTPTEIRALRRAA